MGGSIKAIIDSIFIDLWNTILLQEQDAAATRKKLHDMLDHMLVHGLPEAKPGCIKLIEKGFFTETEFFTTLKAVQAIYHRKKRH